jgi:hypothetical protein
MYNHLPIAALIGFVACGGEIVVDAGVDASYGHTHDAAEVADGEMDADVSDVAVTFPYDAATYDASWYDGGLAGPCPSLHTPCAQPGYIIYGCACFNEHCSDGTWQVIDGGGPCH